MLYGLNIQVKTCDNQSSKNNVEIIKEEKEKITIQYRENKYLIQNENADTYILKIQDHLLKRENKENIPNFILIKSNKKEKIKSTKNSVII